MNRSGVDGLALVEFGNALSHSGVGTVVQRQVVGALMGSEVLASVAMGLARVSDALVFGHLLVLVLVQVQQIQTGVTGLRVELVRQQLLRAEVGVPEPSAVGESAFSAASSAPNERIHVSDSLQLTFSVPLYDV
jgi:hypothetical protein